MAQQTINVGTAPNDGTGTPLRTAFQYTNSNFSELYTAVGPSGNNITVPGTATITGDLTVDTSTLKVDSANNRVGVNTATPRVSLDVASGNAYVSGQFDFGGTGPSAAQGFLSYTGGNAIVGTYGNTSLLFYSNGSEQMRLNSTGLGVGGAPISGFRLNVNNGDFRVSDVQNEDGVEIGWSAGAGSGFVQVYNRTTSAFKDLVLNNAATITSSGNVGIGLTPSPFGSNQAAIESTYGTFVGRNQAFFGANFYYNAADKASTTGWVLGYLQVPSNGKHQWLTSNTSKNANDLANFQTLMTLDASGNLLVGTTTSAGKFTLTQSANADSVSLTGNSGNFLRIYGWSVDNTWNANATAIFVGKQTSTSRSINAGGTVNASGADYAEYMTKGSDFVLSKGGIAGIDANGKLTNVFADAVSFVVKSTDPSYVGNDKWGVGLEGDALEAARQLVDRIAFAGQVPVNVTGAKAGDYIVPVVDGTGIKGIAVSKPTFEQYQLAVGKVIAIDADGRARIIVKVA